MAIEAIKNFLLLPNGIATAGQPTEEQFRDIARAKYVQVINLGLLDPRYCLQDEAGLAESLGLTYKHIPVDFQNPLQSDVQTFFAHMDTIATQPTLVHCAANYRVTTFVGLYSQLRWGWSREQADRLITTWWQPNEVWTAFIAQVRQNLRLA